MIERHAGKALSFSTSSGTSVHIGVHPFFHIVLLKSSIDFLLELVHVLETYTFIRSIIAIFGSIADPSVWNALSRTALELIGFAFIHVNRIGSSSFLK